jgi:hypothetical protein
MKSEVSSTAGEASAISPRSFCAISAYFAPGAQHDRGPLLVDEIQLVARGELVGGARHDRTSLFPASRQHHVRIRDGQLCDLRALLGKGDFCARDARRKEHEVAQVIEVLTRGSTWALNH